MARVVYDQTSPYKNTDQTSWYLRQLQLRDIPPDPEDEPFEITSKYAERPHILSYDLYGTVDFWWIFAVRNPDEIQDPIHDLQSGVEIMIPTAQRIEELLK